MTRKSVVRDQVIEEASLPAISAIVKGCDEDGSWEEVADVISYTSTGVCFYIPRPCSVGNLLSLELDLPGYLRCYDFETDLYQILGLVQISHMSTTVDLAAYQVCVALIGKTPPASFVADPKQNYRIGGMNEYGLWTVVESDSPFVQRKGLRFWAKIDLYLAMIDARRETVGGEKTTTENISRNGAAVVTSLNLNIGDRVKFICEEFDFSGLAVVCNTQSIDKTRSRLSLEFVENQFPIEKLRRLKPKQ